MLRKNSGSILIPVVLAVVGVIAIVAVATNKFTFTNSKAASIAVTKEVELPTLDDSYVSSVYRRANYGSSKVLRSDKSNTAYLKFELSGLIGKKVTSAKLHLNVTNKSGAVQTLSLVTDNLWTEKNITYQNKPASSQTLLTFTPNNTGNYVVELSNIAISQIQASSTLVSFAISSTSTNTFAFNSKEGTTYPKIVVSYEETVQVTPSPRPTNTPTGTPATPMPSMPGTGGGSTSGTDSNDHAMGNAHAFGVWKPWVSKVTAKVVDTCSEAVHNSYYVVGPDGMRYPTWHPAVDPSTGCTFGHEHGYDPNKFNDISRLKKLYAYDGVDGCPVDGVISSCEINAKHTGIPFGYVNEAYSAYAASKNISSMRHEDHYGHKVKYMNNEPIDQGEVAGGDPNNRYDTGVRCNFFGKIHMGVTTKDAFTNNIHEVLEYMHCTDGVEYSVAKLAKFGAPGEFLASCTGTKFESRDNCGPNLVKFGVTSSNSSYPGTCNDGNRSILNRSCLQELVWVPQGKFSGNLYESWASDTGLEAANGSSFVTTDMTIDVKDSIRHYDATKPDGVGYNVDICNETAPSGLAARGGFCDQVTDYHSHPAPSWDDPKALTGTNRGMYFAHALYVTNAGKSAYKLSDPFGENAVDTTENAKVPAGYIKQYVSPLNFSWTSTYKGTLMPNNINVEHDTGNGTVHAPN